MPAGKSVYRGRGHRSKVRSGSALHGVALTKVEMPDHSNLKKQGDTRRVPTAAGVGREHRDV